jgi:uncharacterized membrane protein YeaQ/YmgE (transglycosylase-associated protein family)
MTSASLLIVLIAGTVVGALTGLIVGGNLEALYLAILAGFLGTVIAAIVRNFIMVRGSGVWPDDSRTPMLVIDVVHLIGPGDRGIDFPVHRR